MALKKTPIGELLFGKQLDEKIKAAKILERSSKDLKIPAKIPKNSRGPPRQSNMPHEQKAGRGAGSRHMRSER